ncbi:hypothetical protein ACA910_009537 [Epithemia clementina (nom. ined.)]
MVASSCGIDTTKIETRLFINNEFVNSKSGKTLDCIDPATEKVICSVQEAGPEEVNAAVQAAKAAFDLGSPWRTMDGSARRDLLLRFADLLERDQDYLVRLEALDNGKPLGRHGQYGTAVDIGLVISTFRYFAGWADKLVGKTIPVDGSNFCYTRREPVGVCACIIPWNFPLTMFAWKLAPALCCGNTVVLKTSEKTPLTALHAAKLFQEAQFPAGVVNILSGYGPIGELMARHPDVDKVAFTGSTAVGHKIQQYAAESNLKTVSLELGGKSPMIVLDDANLEEAVSVANMSLFLNHGQCCCAGSRLYVQESIYDQFVAAAIAKAQAIKVGGAFEGDGDFDQGPQVDDIQFQRVMGYIEKGKKEGATVATGGERHGSKGYFIQPTVFTDVTDSMTIAQEEIFGPVLSILKFKTDAEVIERANLSKYGLAAGICSTNLPRALSMAHQLRAGTIWINTYNNFDPAAPFGGFKESGLGRDKGEDGLDIWLETKCVLMPIHGPKA